jgi:hypothetical protein
MVVGAKDAPPNLTVPVGDLRTEALTDIEVLFNDGGGRILAQQSKMILEIVRAIYLSMQ